MYIVTCEEMKRLEKEAISIGISEPLLTENAALGAVGEIIRELPSSVQIFCGKGKNGGDGYAVARHLFNRGIDVTVTCLEKPSGPALADYEIAENMNIDIRPYDGVRKCDLLIDAILGTGINCDVTGLYKTVIESINASGIPVLSLDIPSGINGDTGKVCGCATRAFKTVTFGFPKLGLYSPLSIDYTGDVVTCDISIPRYAPSGKISRKLLTKGTLNLPVKSRASHKGNGGKVLIIGGTGKMPGAPYMAASAAEKCGAGLVTAAVPEEYCIPIMKRLTGAMCVPIDETLPERISKADSVLIGGGMGNNENTLRLVETAVKSSLNTLIIDADGLNVLAENKKILKNKKNIIITPHMGEMSRLTNLSIPEITENRVLIAEDFSREYGVTVVLKGAGTVVAAEGFSTYINSTGNAGMAKGGSGDILAGMIAGFCASKIPEAAALAVYLHGIAGDLGADSIGQYSLTAKDLINFISKAIKCM